MHQALGMIYHQILTVKQERLTIFFSNRQLGHKAVLTKKTYYMASVASLAQKSEILDSVFPSFPSYSMTQVTDIFI